MNVDALDVISHHLIFSLSCECKLLRNVILHRKHCVLFNIGAAEFPLIHTLDSRLTGEDEVVGEGGVKKDPDPPYPLRHHHQTCTQMISPVPSDYGA